MDIRGENSYTKTDNEDWSNSSLIWIWGQFG